MRSMTLKHNVLDKKVERIGGGAGGKEGRSSPMKGGGRGNSFVK